MRNIERVQRGDKALDTDNFNALVDHYNAAQSDLPALGGVGFYGGVAGGQSAFDVRHKDTTAIGLYDDHGGAYPSGSSRPNRSLQPYVLPLLGAPTRPVQTSENYVARLTDADRDAAFKRNGPRHVMFNGATFAPIADYNNNEAFAQVDGSLRIWNNGNWIVNKQVAQSPLSGTYWQRSDTSINGWYADIGGGSSVELFSGKNTYIGGENLFVETDTASKVFRLREYAWASSATIADNAVIADGLMGVYENSWGKEIVDVTVGGSSVGSSTSRNMFGNITLRGFVSSFGYGGEPMVFGAKSTYIFGQHDAVLSAHDAGATSPWDWALMGTAKGFGANAYAFDVIAESGGQLFAGSSTFNAQNYSSAFVTSIGSITEWTEMHQAHYIGGTSNGPAHLKVWDGAAYQDGFTGTVAFLTSGGGKTLKFIHGWATEV